MKKYYDEHRGLTQETQDMISRVNSFYAKPRRDGGRYFFQEIVLDDGTTLYHCGLSGSSYGVVSGRGTIEEDLSLKQIKAMAKRFSAIQY